MLKYETPFGKAKYPHTWKRQIDFQKAEREQSPVLWLSAYFVLLLLLLIVLSQ